MHTFKAGDPVRTGSQELIEKNNVGYNQAARDRRRGDTLGTYIQPAASSGHGECHQIRHSDGTQTWYELEELIPIMIADDLPPVQRMFIAQLHSIKFKPDEDTITVSAHKEGMRYVRKAPESPHDYANQDGNFGCCLAKDLDEAVKKIRKDLERQLPEKLHQYYHFKINYQEIDADGFFWRNQRTACSQEFPMVL